MACLLDGFDMPAEQRFIVVHRLHPVIVEQGFNENLFQQTEPDGHEIAVLAQVKIEAAIVRLTVHTGVIPVFVKSHSSWWSVILQKHEPVPDRIEQTDLLSCLVHDGIVGAEVSFCISREISIRILVNVIATGR